MSATTGHDELIIQFNPGVTEAAKTAAIDAVMANRQESIHIPFANDWGTSALEVIALPQGASVDAALAKLNQNPVVAYAELNRVITTQAVADDPYIANGYQWGTLGDGTAPGNIYGSQADEVWASGNVGSSSVVVGIIDEGIDFSHPDLAANIWTNPGEVEGNGIDDDGNGYIDDIHGWDFYNNDNTIFDGTATNNVDRHGTHVAGTIGAVGGNGLGVAGINWNVQMIAAKFLGPGGGPLSAAVKALDYLTMLKTTYGVNIVASNNSWSSASGSLTLQGAISRAANAGILFVASAGNEGANNDVTPTYPSNYNTEASAGYDNVISVAAIDKVGGLASFSNYGAANVDLGAPGVGIYSTLPFGAYGSMSGTSMAAPHVTGAIALYAASHPGATAAEIKEAILTAAEATATSSLTGKTVTGGRLNLNPSAPTASSIIGGVSASVNYTENSSVILASAATVTNANFAGGVLRIEISGNPQSADQLAIKHKGTTAGKIGVSGSTLTYSGTVIGSFTGGAGSTPLVVTLGAAASQPAVQALLRSLVYSNSSDAPSTQPRTVQYKLTDGDGGVSNSVQQTINIIAVNDKPVLGNLTPLAAYIENASPILLAAAGTVADLDSPNFANGSLVFKIAMNGQNTDRLSIRNQGSASGQIGISGTNVTYGGTVIGTFSSSTKLIVTLNSNASRAAVQALLRNVTFHCATEAPSTLTRTITAALNDGDGGVSVPLTSQVTVTAINDDPVIGSFDTTVKYIEGNSPILLDVNATVADDSVNFASGSLTVRLSANGQSSDRLGIRNQGLSAGQIGVSGNRITYGGVLIGTFTGGTSGSVPLVFQFNSAANQLAVRALIRNLSFSNVSDDPSTSPRTIELQLTDGDGGTSVAATKVINVAAVS